MSLSRQLWLVILMTTLLALGGSFLVSVVSSRNYLEEQLAIKNNDNATALALSLSQHEGTDTAARELLVAAQFDTGYYQSIRLTDPFGKVVVDKHAKAEPEGVPAWFSQLLHIESVPGTAQITRGWKQQGSVTVVSHASFAYTALWRSAQQLAGWMALAGLITGALATLVLRRIQRPLNAVVAQAEAIGERRFVTIPPPGVPELDRLANAMSGMVTRLKSMFDEEATRLDELQRRTNLDALTALANREHFHRHLQALLASDEAAAGGTLLLLRVPELAQLNQHFGRGPVDELLTQLAEVLREAARGHDDAMPARLNGADFALAMPGLEDGRGLAENLLAKLREVLLGWPGIETIAHIGIGHYRRGMNAGPVLARADRALAAAEAYGGNNWQSAADEDSAFQPINSAEWAHDVRQAIAQRALRLVAYPVCDFTGARIHDEAMLRIRIGGEQADWIPAGQVMPMAARLRLTPALDLAVLTLALERLAADPQVRLAINFAADSLANEEFAREAAALLRSTPHAARLAVECPEVGVFRHFAAVKRFRDALAGSPLAFGIEHVGRRFGEFGRLQELGLAYVKVDAIYIRGVEASADNQAFLKGLAGIAHGMGARVIAEGVQQEAELKRLPDLGFDGATGPAVTAAFAKPA